MYNTKCFKKNKHFFNLKTKKQRPSHTNLVKHTQCSQPPDPPTHKIKKHKMTYKWNYILPPPPHIHNGRCHYKGLIGFFKTSFSLVKRRYTLIISISTIGETITQELGCVKMLLLHKNVCILSWDVMFPCFCVLLWFIGWSHAALRSNLLTCDALATLCGALMQRAGVK